MFDINTAINTAIAAAVAEATAPLLERIAALENNPAQGVDTTLETRLLALEESKGMTAAAFVTYLDSQEWFWEKVRRFADAAAEAHMEEHMEQASHLDEDDIQSRIDCAIEQHEENRTHGDEDDIEEMVQKLLNSASISITV